MPPHWSPARTASGARPRSRPSGACPASLHGYPDPHTSRGPPYGRLRRSRTAPRRPCSQSRSGPPRLPSPRRCGSAAPAYARRASSAPATAAGSSRCAADSRILCGWRRPDAGSLPFRAMRRRPHGIPPDRAHRRSARSAGSSQRRADTVRKARCALPPHTAARPPPQSASAAAAGNPAHRSRAGSMSSRHDTPPEAPRPFRSLRRRAARGRCRAHARTYPRVRSWYTSG